MSEIRIENLNKKIKGSVILDDISLTMTPGRIYGLRGKNGCGKTMLMRAISGLINPDEGYVKIGEKIIGKDISFPESIGLLLEYPGFVRKYSGFKNLKMIASLKGIAGDNQIKNTMIKTGLNPENKKSFGSYSLGMKQKLGIACAIMENPELIILDEPVNALDEFSIKNIAGIIEEQKNNGALIIVSAHSKELLLSFCDEIFYMDDGRIIKNEKIQQTDNK